MSYENEISKISDLAVTKSVALKNQPLKLGVGGLQAGAYVGVAIILIMTLGAVAPAAVRPLIMGSTFGLALILVVIGGADLFTGHNLYSSVAVATRKLSLYNATKLNLWVFTTNLVGAAILVVIYWLGQGPLTHAESAEFLQTVAARKMHLPAVALVARGILCNWLVCLALWMALRVDSTATKCIVIAWCLLAFIAAGFEHSVANMTVHLLALFGPANELISIAGAAHNLLWVTVGNVIGGALFVGLAYTSQTARQPVASPSIGTDQQ